jgi:predicted transcriptional regulator YdeE
MKTRLVNKDTFAVIGKVGEGVSANSKEWIPQLWQEANKHFDEIASIVKKDESGAPLIWGAMNDVTENNKVWSNRGKYMVGCEATISAEPPEGWNKWLIPSQRYLVADCTQETYANVFSTIMNDSAIQIVGTVHERYPRSNTGLIELWFPVEDMTITKF